MLFKTRVILMLIAGTTLGGCAVSSPTPNNTRTLNDIARLNNLQGQQGQRIDQIEKQLQLLENRLQEQQAVMADLQQRATQKGTSIWQKTEPATAAEDTIPSQGSPTELYLQAFADYAAGRYPQAITGFKTFIDTYPGNNYAGNAQYWLGECYYALEDYRQAVQEFEKAAYQYPDSGKAPEALLKMIPALRRLNRIDQAREVRQLLLRRYPDSSAAARAKADN